MLQSAVHEEAEKINSENGRHDFFLGLLFYF